MAKNEGPDDTQLRAILVADIEGYTRLMSRDEAAAHEHALRCLNLFKEAVAGSDGELIKTTGDGAIFEFATATGAIQFGIDVQARLRKLNQEVAEDQRPHFRIGVHLGEIMHHGGDIYGHTVNVAARIEQFAEPDGICITRIVYDLVRTKMSIGFESIGRRRLKNVPELVEIYRVRVDVDSAVQLPAYRASDQAFELPGRPSIAVLAFESESPATIGEFFTDGVTEDIIANLSKFEELFVIARNSSFIFKGTNARPQDVAKELGVRYVLQGTARAAGDRMRVTTELTDASTGRNVWAESYDRNISEIFAVQDEITQVIVTTLAAKVQIVESDCETDMASDNLNAYHCLLRGREQLVMYTAEANVRARAFFEAALEFNPKYAPACAGIARTYNYDWQFSWGDDHEGALDRALEWANKAVSFDRSSTRGHAERGFTMLFKKQTKSAINELRLALSLNPNDADTMAELSDALMYDGQVDEAVSLLHAAMRLNPYYPDRYLWYLADAHYALREYEEAIEAIHRMANQSAGSRLLAASCAKLDRMPEARHYAEMVLQQQPDFSVTAYMNRQPDTVPIAAQEYADGLLKAGLPA